LPCAIRFFLRAAGFVARGPGELAELSGEKHFAGGGLIGEFAARIARGVKIRGGEGDGLLDSTGGVKAKNEQFRVAVEEDGEATFGGGAECGGVHDAVGTFVDKLASDTHGSDGKRGSGESGARYGNDADIVAITDTSAGGEHQLGGVSTAPTFRRGALGSSVMVKRRFSSSWRRVSCQVESAARFASA